MARPIKTAEGNPFEVLKPVSSDTIETVYTGGGRRGTMYQPIIDALKKLRVGNSLPVNVPKGTNIKAFINRVGGALRTHPVDHEDKDIKFRMSHTPDGKQLVIAAHKPVTPAPKPAAK